MNVGLLSYLRFQKECKREIQIVLPKLQIAPLTLSIKIHGFILRFNVFISAKLVKIITRHLLFIVFYVFIPYIIVMLAQVCAILLFYGHLSVQEFLPWCSSSTHTPRLTAVRSGLPG